MNEGDLKSWLSVLVVVEGFAYLVDPELESQEEAAEAFLLEDTHCFFFVCL